MKSPGGRDACVCCLAMSARGRGASHLYVRESVCVEDKGKGGTRGGSSRRSRLDLAPARRPISERAGRAQSQLLGGDSGGGGDGGAAACSSTQPLSYRLLQPYTAHVAWQQVPPITTALVSLKTPSDKPGERSRLLLPLTNTALD